MTARGIFAVIALLFLMGFALRGSASGLGVYMDGRYPALCDHSSLTADQAKQVRAAEHRANLNLCLDGRYVALCRHEDLTAIEVQKVQKAEHAANLNSCLDGRYPMLCKHEELTNEESKRVREAEHIENLKVCLLGKYRNLCRHEELSPDESTRVQAAEASVQSSEPPQRSARSRPSRAGRSGCEDGHWIDSVMDDGSVIKLEDGSIWEVDSVDTVDSSLWLSTTDVIVCGDKMINTEDNETVHIERIR